MTALFENIDTLQKPYEAFFVDSHNKNDPTRPHWHYYIELIYVESGDLYAECDRRKTVLHPGDFAVFYPKTVHTLKPLAGDSYRYGVIKVDVSRLSDSSVYTPKLRTLLAAAKSDESISPFIPGSEPDAARLPEVFRECVRELEDKCYGYDLMVHTLLTAMLVNIIRVFKSRGLNVSVPNSAVSVTSIDSVTEYIDEHSSEALRVEDLAEMCHLSYSCFAKKFHQMYGRSCREYIEFIRVSKAEDLLLFTDFDLSYISEETGFSDCSHLIKVFKKWKGDTPKQYRMRLQSTR